MSIPTDAMNPAENAQRKESNEPVDPMSLSFDLRDLNRAEDQLAAERAAIKEGLHQAKRDQLAAVEANEQEGLAVALQTAARMRAQVDREAARVALALRKAEAAKAAAAQQQLAVETEARKVAEARDRESGACARRHRTKMH
jgi:hypothetical protein